MVTNNISGKYEFYKGKDKICDLSFTGGELKTICSPINTELLPPFLRENISEKQDIISALKTFFMYRRPKVGSPVYPLLEKKDITDYSTLFDEYHLGKESPLPYDFDYDPVVLSVLKGADWNITHRPSVNLGIASDTYSFFYTENGNRFLLTAYSISKVNEKKTLGIPYRIIIKYEVPFILTPLRNDAEYFYTRSLLPQGISEGEIKDFLIKRGFVHATDYDDSVLLESYIIRIGNTLSLTFL